jgi:RimJ/RimL family protein N-acetyltransferase
VELRDYTDADARFTERLETDPAVMAELGGAVAPEALAEVHARRLATVENGDWWFVIEDGGEPVGVIGVWPHEVEGRREHEVGWMVVPERQGEGIASRALAMVLERARSDGRFPVIHAFPGISNKPSNALCARAGFDLVGSREVTYKGAPFECNQWTLRL